MSKPCIELPISMPELQAGKAEITMAPLIDVVFLLLIFFMIATVFPENRGLIVEQPESNYSHAINKKDVVLLINSKGSIYLQNKKIRPAEVQQFIKKQLESAPDTGVLIRVDRKATTQALITVMDACKQGGAKKIGIATDAIKPVPHS